MRVYEWGRSVVVVVGVVVIGGVGVKVMMGRDIGMWVGRCGSDCEELEWWWGWGGGRRMHDIAHRTITQPTASKVVEKKKLRNSFKRAPLEPKKPAFKQTPHPL